MLAAHLENLLFLLLLVVGALFQLLARAARKTDANDVNETTKSPPQPPKPIRRARPESDQERVRKFLEALGNPPAAAPQPGTADRSKYRKPRVLPRIPPIGPPLPPLVTRPPPDVPSEFEVHHEPVPVRVGESRAAQPSTQPVFEVHESAAPTAPTPIPSGPIPHAIVAQSQAVVARRAVAAPALLQSTSNLREAIVLREILGPPRALQAFDLL